MLAETLYRQALVDQSQPNANPNDNDDGASAQLGSNGQPRPLVGTMLSGGIIIPTL